MPATAATEIEEKSVTLATPAASPLIPLIELEREKTSPPEAEPESDPPEIQGKDDSYWDFKF